MINLYVYSDKFISLQTKYVSHFVENTFVALFKSSTNLTKQEAGDMQKK